MLLELVRTYLWQDVAVRVAASGWSNLAQSRDDYHTLYGIAGDPDPLAVGRLDALLAAAILAQAMAQPGEQNAYSMRFPTAGYGLFAGTEPEGSVCGRVVRPVAKEASALLVVQTVEPDNGPLTQSSLELAVEDPVAAMEQYFNQSRQTATRFLMDEQGMRAALLQLLPGGDEEWLRQTDAKVLWARLEEERVREDTQNTRPLREMVAYYGCRCNDAFIGRLWTSLSADERRHAADQTGVARIVCPRCGRTYLLNNSE